MTQVDLIVVNYKTDRDLLAFGESLKWLDDLDYKLWIVNVESREEDRKAAAELVPHRTINFADNVGYAYAINHTALLGDAPLLAFCNADILFTESLQPMLHDFLRHPQWGAIGPRQTDHQFRITAGGIFGTGDQPKMRGWRRPDCNTFRDIRDDAVSVIGSMLVTRRSAWNEMWNCPIYTDQFPRTLGAFLPTRHYYEETGYCYHLRHHGWKLAYHGETHVHHFWHQASPLGGPADKMMSESRQIFRDFCDVHGITHD